MYVSFHYKAYSNAADPFETGRYMPQLPQLRLAQIVQEQPRAAMLRREAAASWQPRWRVMFQMGAETSFHCCDTAVLLCTSTCCYKPSQTWLLLNLDTATLEQQVHTNRLSHTPP